MESDIVERLAGWCPHEDECPRVLIDEAADEIERLRAELAAMREQRDEARELCCIEATHRSVYLGSVIDARTIARDRGWEGLFKQRGGA